MLFVFLGFLPIGADLSIQKSMAIGFAMISIDGVNLAALGRFSKNVIFAGFFLCSFVSNGIHMGIR